MAPFDITKVTARVKEIIEEAVLEANPHSVAAQIDADNARLKAQVVRMAHIAITALGQGVRPALAIGLNNIIAEAGFGPEPDEGNMLIQERIALALQEANRAAANAAVADACQKHEGQLFTADGIPIWYHPSTNDERRACRDDGWLEVNGWKPLTEEVAKVHRK